MADTRIWICPALCGCEISMTAAWAGPSSVDDRGRTVSYRHPVPFTATNLAIINVCAAHAGLCSAGVATDPWPGRPGYLTRPIPSATPAESLYVHLWGVHGQAVALDSCGCVVHQVYDEASGTARVSGHPKYTRKCSVHVADDDRHTIALTENRTLNQVRHALLLDDAIAEAALDEDGNPYRRHKPGCQPRVFYDAQRQLQAQLRGATTVDVIRIAAALARRFPVVVS